MKNCHFSTISSHKVQIYSFFALFSAFLAKKVVCENVQSKSLLHLK